MRRSERLSALHMRRRLERGIAGSAAFRQALANVAVTDQDAWVDAALGLPEIPDDDEALPRGCVSYLPCAVPTVLDLVELAGATASDRFVDIGAGAGRTLALVRLLTGAACVGLEIQPHLVRAARVLVGRLRLEHTAIVEGDAAELARHMTIGTVFFLYCPFSDARLDRTLAALEDLARARPLRVCALDVPLPRLPWLASIGSRGGLEVYASALDGRREADASCQRR